MKHLLRIAWVGLLLTAMMLLGALNAQASSAHAARVSSEPADNAILAAGPNQVSATFNERLQTTFAAMTVVGPDGNLWNTGDTSVQGAVVSSGLRPLGPVGTYTVNYRVTSADGHVVSGSWPFRLTMPGTGSPGLPAAARSDDGGDVPAWPFAAATVAIVGAGALWAMRRGP
jgi:methionine-rich copper-binding protein CopC